MFGNMALDEDRRPIEADGEEHCGQAQGLGTDDSGPVDHGEGVEIDDPMEGIDLVLADDPIAKCTQIVAQMDLAGRLDTRQNPGHIG